MKTLSEKTIARVKSLTESGSHAMARITLAHHLRLFDLNLRSRTLYGAMMRQGSVIGLGDSDQLNDLLAIGRELIERTSGKTQEQVIYCLS